MPKKQKGEIEQIEEEFETEIKIPKKPLKLVVGLGNPGKEYEYTRHNVGFMAIDDLASMLNTKINKKKKKGVIGVAETEKFGVILLKPYTFMNLSGEAVLYIASFMKIEPEDIIVICDDVALQLGQIRIRDKGSSGGHKGLLSIIQLLKTDQFVRVRIGVGEPPPEVDLKDWVLMKFSIAEYQIVKRAIIRAVNAILEILKGEPLEKVMQKYNAWPPLEE